TAAAEASPGVRAVWTYRNVPAQGERPADAPYMATTANPALESDRVRHFGQVVAFAVADTLENAEAAAHLVRLSYQADAPQADFDAGLGAAVLAASDPDVEIGDFAAGFDSAPVKLDATWTTPVHIHCPMEPCATTAWWEDGKCVVHTSV